MQDTRSKILQMTSQEMYQHGFRGMRIEDVLSKVGVAKGALYHYFKNKTDLGYAVVDEVIRDLTIEKWMQPLEDFEDPIEGLSHMVRTIFNDPPEGVIEAGCPLNNLAQEMSTEDEGFRQRVDDIYILWRKAITDALKNGQKKNNVRKDIDTDKVGAFIVASITGSVGNAKTAQSRQLLKDCGESLVGYLESLRCDTGEIL